MFKKLIEKHNQNKLEKETVKLEKKRNKPEFQLKDLYVAEIVLYKKVNMLVPAFMTIFTFL